MTGLPSLPHPSLPSLPSLPVPALPPLSPHLARHERSALCSTALVVGEDAPTLCEGWDVKDLICHLLLRESSLIGAPGMAVPALSGLTDREMHRLRRQPFAHLVERLESTKLRAFALPPVDAAFNTLEYFVHHEDIRRAQPGWRRRALSHDDLATLWRAIKASGPTLLRRAGVPVVIRCTDNGETATLRSGQHPVEVSGPLSEIVLFLHGRDAVRDLEFSGPEEAVARLRDSGRGV